MLIFVYLMGLIGNGNGEQSLRSNSTGRNKHVAQHKMNHGHVKSHGHKNFESSIRTYDRDLFHASLNLLDTMKIEIRGFYHVSTTIRHWLEVLEEHIMLLDGKRFPTNLFSSHQPDRKQITNVGMRLSTGWSSVLEIAESIQVNVDSMDGQHKASSTYQNVTDMLLNLHTRGGAQKIHVKINKEAQMNAISETLSAPDHQNQLHRLASLMGEISTLSDVYDYCQQRVKKESQNAYVFFLHNQESMCAVDEYKHMPLHKISTEPFTNDIINSFIVEFPSICLIALLSGYATCGTDFQEGVYDTNIWWANCHHIANLANIDEQFGTILNATISTLSTSSTSTNEDNRRLTSSNVSHALEYALHAGQMLKDKFLYSRQDTDDIQRTADDATQREAKCTTTEVTSNSSSSSSSFMNRCAYNLYTGTKPDQVVHTIANGIEDVSANARCSRSEYRFSLIDVLSGLHDDSMLYNRRHNMPSLVTEMYLKDYSHHDNHKCF